MVMLGDQSDNTTIFDDVPYRVWGEAILPGEAARKCG